MSVAQLEKPKTSVPGQYLGYALQPVRLCFHLLDAPSDASVSLEHIDDVAVHYADGTHLLEQSKSALSGNPASDRSVELWKSLANWADLCVAGTVTPANAIFRYYITPGGDGEVVQRLHNAKDAKAAAALLAELSTAKFKGKPEVGAGSHIRRFLAGGAEICTGIIQKFELVTDADPITSISGKLHATLPPNVVDSFVSAAIGQAKGMVEQLIRDKQVPVVSVDGFRKWFQAFIRKHNLANLLEPTTSLPSPDEIDAVLSDAPLFVRQLTVVEASQDLLVTAVSDYLRATADKINWAAAGSIVEESLDELDNSLKRHHTIQADEVAELLAREAAEFRGRALYRKCIQLQLPLEGRPLPSHFIPGAFNCLANTSHIGWHPDYATLFGIS